MTEMSLEMQIFAVHMSCTVSRLYKQTLPCKVCFPHKSKKNGENIAISKSLKGDLWSFYTQMVLWGLWKLCGPRFLVLRLQV